ncbi:hypothetical protein [Xanthomonas sp. 60]
MNLNTMPVRGLLIATLLVGGTAATPAAEPAAPSPLSLQEHAVVSSAAYLKGHPDLRYRQLGMAAAEQRKFVDARRYYTLAARHADKLSQALMAELLWNGQGGPADRALGYAWMDLAAERGTEWLLLRREAYWAALDEAERKRAVDEGQALYAEFADPVAKPRQEKEMRRNMGEMTGSRTGALGSTVMQVRFNGQLVRVLPEVYYAPRLWQPDAYWNWQAQQLQEASAAVNVGTPRTLPSR